MHSYNTTRKRSVTLFHHIFTNTYRRWFGLKYQETPLRAMNFFYRENELRVFVQQYIVQLPFFNHQMTSCAVFFVNVMIVYFKIKNVIGWRCVSWSLKPNHDDVSKWKHFPRYWPFVRGIHRSPVNSPHKDQWRGTLMFSLICTRINCWINNREAGDLKHHRAHYDVIAMHHQLMFINMWSREGANIPRSLTEDIGVRSG